MDAKTDDKNAGKNYVVEMQDNKFMPKDVEIKVGDTITWKNTGSNKP